MLDHHRICRERALHQLDDLRQRQVESGDGAGGLVDTQLGFPFAHPTAVGIRVWVSLWADPESPLREDEDLLGAVEKASRYLLRCLHRDGTVDLPTTNFHSPPDTAFVLQELCPALQVLRAYDRSLAELETFVERAAHGVAAGGIHTPNHRWVVAGALALANGLFPSEAFRRQSAAYLSEGIDQNPDGEYTERSNVTYNPIVNRSLIMASEGWQRPDLLEYVRRNLDMMLYLTHPDGTVVTDYSTRQDRGQKGDMARYYDNYLIMAAKDRNPVYARMADQILQRCKDAGSLDPFLRRSDLDRLDWLERAELPGDYERSFAASQVVRVRRGHASATVLGRHPNFFSLKYGKMHVVVRMTSAFFGRAQFEGELSKLSEAGAERHVQRPTYILEQHLNWGYFGPLPEARRGSSDWFAVPRSERPRTHVQDYYQTARVRRAGNGFDLDLEVQGQKGVPVAVEISVHGSDEFTCDGRLTNRAEAYVLAAGWLTCRADREYVRVGPGCGDHTWTEIRGALPRLEGTSFYITTFSPRRLRLRLEYGQV